MGRASCRRAAVTTSTPCAFIETSIAPAASAIQNHTLDIAVTSLDSCRPISHPVTGIDKIDPTATPSSAMPNGPVEIPNPPCTSGIHYTHVAKMTPWKKNTMSTLARAAGEDCDGEATQYP